MLCIENYSQIWCIENQLIPFLIYCIFNTINKLATLMSSMSGQIQKTTATFNELLQKTLILHMIFTIPASMAQTLIPFISDSSSLGWDENVTASAVTVKPSAPLQSLQLICTDLLSTDYNTLFSYTEDKQAPLRKLYCKVGQISGVITEQ